MAIPMVLRVFTTEIFLMSIFHAMARRVKLNIMTNFDDFTGENKNGHNPHWLQTHDHSYKILLIVGSGSGKPKASHNLISYQLHIDKKLLVS